MRVEMPATTQKVVQFNNRSILLFSFPKTRSANDKTHTAHLTQARVTLRSRHLFPMAFINSSSFVSGGRALVGKQCDVRLARATVKVQRVSRVRMETDWTGPAPSSDVLGIGKDIASSSYIGFSVAALVGGIYCVYASNIAAPLTADTVRPLYVVGSLLLPISWGL